MVDESSSPIPMDVRPARSDLEPCARIDGPTGRKQKPIRAECARCVLRVGLGRAGLAPVVVNTFCDSMWMIRARKRQVLTTEGSPATHLFAVRSGAVKLLRVGSDGRSHVTAVLETGALFGFEALFERTYRTDAEMLVDGELCVADVSALHAMLHEAPALGLELARFLHSQLTIAQERLAMLGASGARARVASYLLLRLGDEPNTPHLRQNLTLEELGGVLGLTGETVCRMLADLRARGAISTDRQTITVLDPVALRRLARL